MVVRKSTMGKGNMVGQKTLGRVSAKNMYKHANAPIEFQTDDYDFFSTEKTAAPIQGHVTNPILTGALMAAGGTLASAAIAAAYGYGKDKFDTYINKSKYEESLRTAIQMSPTLQRYGFNKLNGFMPMIIKASPTVAEEPRLLANYLESMIDAEGHLNMATFSELANIESTVLRNNDLRNSGITRDLALNFAKGIGEESGKTLTNSYFKNNWPAPQSNTR